MSKIKDKSDGYKESEPGIENRNPVPILASGIGTRIKATADLIGTRVKAATAAGVSDDMLYRYIREESPPSFTAMAGLARKAGVSLEWLAFDEGSMRPERLLGVGGEKVRYNELTAQAAVALLQRLFSEEGYEPSGMWGVTLVSLLVSGDITEAGVRQVLDRLKHDASLKSS